ncbi:MAG: zinc dependent phospholipase C family protein [Clostridia bacterium]|nr:zinc dependent phospholipase C family protein [Clostridia bacterium]
MPNWKTHLEVGKRLNKYLKYNEKEFNMFLIGSILPDINNSHIVTDISEKIGHDVTHIRKQKNPSYIEFYNKYSEKIINDNPIFVGYFAHLYTDEIWNNHFYQKNEIIQMKDKSHDELRVMKQKDFEIYNSKFIDNIIELDNITEVLEQTMKIVEVSITKEDIEKVIEFLKNQNVIDGKLKLHTEDELEELMNETVEQIYDFLKIKRIDKN